jgi:hypothetical protein
MADNPSPKKPGFLPPLPSSGTTGKLKSPTTQLPGKKLSGAGKIVVMLSSVAKPAPATTQSLLSVPPVSSPTPKIAAADAPQVAPTPPPLPPKEVVPGATPPPQSRVSSTTFVKLPPKTSIPRLGALTTMPMPSQAPKDSPASKIAPPPLPAKSEPKKSGPHLIPPIKLNEPSSSSTPDSPSESLISGTAPAQPTPKPAGWKSLEPGELNPPAGALEKMEIFERSQRILPKPEPEKTPVTKSTPLVAPALVPPGRVESLKSPATPSSSLNPPLPTPSIHVAPPMVEKAPESTSEKLAQPHLPFAVQKSKTPPEPTPSAPVHVAPPMVGKAPESSSEKLALPHLPVAAQKSETVPEPTPSAPVHKAPAMAQPEAASTTAPPPASTAKALPPVATTPAKGPASWMKASAPLVLSSTAKVQIPRPMEAKPAVRPAVLPRRFQPTAREDAPATPPAMEKPKAPEPLAKSNVVPPAAAATPLYSASGEILPLVVSAAAAKVTETVLSKEKDKEKPKDKDKEKPEAKAAPGQIPPAVPVATKTKGPVPLTRAERAKKRRVIGTVLFWAVLFPATVAVIFIGSLKFGRDTRVEGQVIPPAGMPLNNEVWIVTDFSSLASGIAEDLAAERAPILQEIQERQDHVQRAQADIAAREERIRLIQADMDSAKQEIDTVIKQARDATQHIWDGEGAQIDAEYQSRQDQLKAAIADRAKSLNLKYEPDPAFPSPEVWANAYRLALYEVPAGVDSVKEHAWLGDQMKQWRDFLKSLDDRKEQLREQAAQVKLAPAPKIADLNAKIEGLQQRIDGTTAEEAPLKAELQQAQADLADAQSSEAGLDDKYYKQLESLPPEAISKRITLRTNGRFTWVDDDVFAEGETERHYYIFSRATRADGREYWALHDFTLRQNLTTVMYIEPGGFISTKAILRPDLTPDEQEQ